MKRGVRFANYSGMALQESTIAAAPGNLHEAPAFPNEEQTAARNNPLKLADLQPYQLVNFALFVSKETPPFAWDQLREILLDQEEDEIIFPENLPDDKLERFYAEVLELAKNLPDIDVGSITDAGLAKAYYAEVNEQLLSAEWAAWNDDMALLQNLELITDYYERYFKTNSIDVKEQIVSDIFSAISPTFLPEQIVVEKNAKGTVRNISRNPPLPSRPPKPGNDSTNIPLQAQQFDVHAHVRNLVRELQADLIKLKQSQSMNLSERDRLIATSIDEAEEKPVPASLLPKAYAAVSVAAAESAVSASAAEPGFDTSAAAVDGDSNASVDGSFEAEADRADKEEANVEEPSQSSKTGDEADDHITLIAPEYPVGKASASGHVTDAPEALEFAVDVPVLPTSPTKPVKSRTPSAMSGVESPSRSNSASQQQPAVVDNRKRTRASRSVSPNKKWDAVAGNMREPTTALLGDETNSSTDDLTTMGSQRIADVPSPVIAVGRQLLRSFVTPNVFAMRLSSPAVSSASSIAIPPPQQPSSSASSRHSSQSPVRSSRQPSAMRTRSSLHANEPSPSPVPAAASEDLTTTMEDQPGSPAKDLQSSPNAGTPTTSPSRTLSRASLRRRTQSTTVPVDAVKTEPFESENDAGTPHAATDEANEADVAEPVVGDDVDSDMPKTDQERNSDEMAAAAAELVNLSNQNVDAAVPVRSRHRLPSVASVTTEAHRFLTAHEQLSGSWLSSFRQLLPLVTARCVFDQLITHTPAFLALFDAVRKGEARNYEKLVKMPVSVRDILKYALTQQRAPTQPQRQVTMFNDKTPVIQLHLASTLAYVNCVAYNEATGALGQTAAQLLTTTRDELTQRQVANKLIGGFYKNRRSSNRVISMVAADDAADVKADEDAEN